MDILELATRYGLPIIEELEEARISPLLLSVDVPSALFERLKELVTEAKADAHQGHLIILKNDGTADMTMFFGVDWTDEIGMLSGDWSITGMEETWDEGWLLIFSITTEEPIARLRHGIVPLNELTNEHLRYSLGVALQLKAQAAAAGK